MKRLAVVIGLAAAFALALGGFSRSARADFCFLCAKDSSDSCSGKNYCKPSSGKDDSDSRKACKAKGCKISGTGSCPSSDSNVCQAAAFDVAPQPLAGPVTRVASGVTRIVTDAMRGQCTKRTAALLR